MKQITIPAFYGDSDANADRGKVLVEVSADGFARAFTTFDCDVRIINRPIASTPAAGNLVDELVESALPLCYQQIYDAEHCRTNANLRPITPQQVQERLAHLQLLEALGNINKEKPMESRPNHLIFKILQG